MKHKPIQPTGFDTMLKSFVRLLPDNCTNAFVRVDPNSQTHRICVDDSHISLKDDNPVVKEILSLIRESVQFNAYGSIIEISLSFEHGKVSYALYGKRDVGYIK